MIDWNRVLQLREEVGEDAFAGLAAAFLAEIEDRLAQLGRQPEQLPGDLHYLRGAALNLGFARFSALLLAEEMRLRHGDAGRVGRDDLVGTFRDSRRQFLDELHCVTGIALPDARP